MVYTIEMKIKKVSAAERVVLWVSPDTRKAFRYGKKKAGLKDANDDYFIRFLLDQ